MKIINKVLTGAFLMCAGVAFAATDAADMPLVLTVKSNIYGYQGPDNQFTIYLGATENDTEFYVEGPKTQEYVYVDRYSIGQDSDGDNVAIATPVYCSVTGTDNTIKIYGDASKLDYIDVHGCYLNSVELGDGLVNLSVIDLSHNELTEIDLSECVNLASIDLLDNAFSVPSRMKIGTVHPNLLILSVGINDVIDPELNISNFPQLQYFSARSNYGLTSVDPTGCPNLVSLVLEVTNVSHVDVSQNPILSVLNLSNTRVTDVDLSANPYLGELYISHDGSFNSESRYKLRSIDLSKNPRLEFLDLSGNALTEIDVTKNTYLKLLYLQRNLLTEIDLSKCNMLYNLDLSRNYFNFNTLPLPREGVAYFYYQNPLPLDLKYRVGETIDFSSQVLRAPFTDSSGAEVVPQTYAAVFALPRARDEYEVDPSAYSFVDGKITFREAIPDSVYVAFYCTAFPDWDLRTSTFMVKTPEEYDLPSTVFSFTPAADMAGREVVMSLSAGARIPVDEPVDVTLLVGSETMVIPSVLSADGVPVSMGFTLPAAHATVKVCLPDGLYLTSLFMDGISLEDIDISQSDLIEHLGLTDASLRNIDLSYNRELRSLDLSGNSLTFLSLAGVRGDYEKWLLSDINLSRNSLSGLSAVYYESIRNLNLSENAFREFDAKYYKELRSLDLSGNSLAGTLDISACAAIQSLNVRGNAVSSLKLPSGVSLNKLDISNNALTFASLPMPSSAKEYTYAPQDKMNILHMASSIDLSAQNVDKQTVYRWKYAESDELVPVDLYTESDGVFNFGPALRGTTIYCELTNPLFPAFEEMPLTTSETLVSERPDVLVASFTTTQNGVARIGFSFNRAGDNAIYVDWKGDGSDFVPYIYNADGSSPIYREGTTYAGRTAKVYTFDSAEEVAGFFMDATPLKDFDGSPMTKLKALDIHKAGLKDGSLKLPESRDLYELVLDGNDFEKQAFPNLPGLSNLNLAANRYESFDFSVYPSLMFAQLADNRIREVKFGGNGRLYQIDLQGNDLSSIDLEGLTGLQELLLSGNNLSSIDLSPVKDRLHALWIAGNRFTLESLPLATEIGANLSAYDYSNQKPMEVSVTDGCKIDLSTQARVAGTPTVFRWFLGDRQSDVYYDYYEEEFVGDELNGGSDDPDFIVEEGVTTFLRPQSKKVICAMTNAWFPNLILYTQPASVEVSMVEEILTDREGVFNVYSTGGLLLRRVGSMEEAIQGLAPGLYIINNSKILIR